METDALVKQAQDGDKQALAELWDTITPKLFGYLINVVKDKQLAEDVLQSTWLKAVTNIGQFGQRGSNFSAWLFAIAKNECRQHWRKHKDEALTENLLQDREPSHTPKYEHQILVEQILNLLSEDDKELIRLRYIADLPINDIAKILNINFVAVRVRLHRALAKARAAAQSQTI